MEELILEEVKFYNEITDDLLKFAVIISRTNGRWVFCKHKERDSFEVPGGHREDGVYSVKGKTRINEELGEETFGMLFIANINSFENELHSEIEKIFISYDLVDNWTYPLIQPKLIDEARRRGFI